MSAYVGPVGLPRSSAGCSSAAGTTRRTSPPSPTPTVGRARRGPRSTAVRPGTSGTPRCTPPCGRWPSWRARLVDALLDRPGLLWPYVQWSAILFALCLAALAWVAGDLAARLGGRDRERWTRPLAVGGIRGCSACSAARPCCSTAGFTNFMMGVTVVVVVAYLGARSLALGPDARLVPRPARRAGGHRAVDAAGPRTRPDRRRRRDRAAQAPALAGRRPGWPRRSLAAVGLGPHAAAGDPGRRARADDRRLHHRPSGPSAAGMAAFNIGDGTGCPRDRRPRSRPS